MFKLMELMGDQPKLPGQHTFPCLPQVLISVLEAQEPLNRLAFPFTLAHGAQGQWRI